jgi:peptide chain release factor 1
MQPSQINKLEKMERRYEELHRLLSDPQVARNRDLLQKYSRESGKLEESVSLWQRYRKIEEEMGKLRGILTDEKEEEDIKQLAREEEGNLEKDLESLQQKLTTLLLPQDSYAQRNVIMEIRAGTGGEEAALFAADLCKMYSRFGGKKNWKIENMDFRLTPRGGIKEAIFAVEGKNVFKTLRFESGVHRVQRVPITESSGRTHTSTVTVAVLPEPEEIEVEINPEDLRIDTFHASGAGGQHVNVTDSAVRITHNPTGLTAQCQDERSQHQNKIKALRILRAKLLQAREEKQHNEISEQRKAQIGRGDRSERIRTYNFSEGRVTDHRFHVTVYNLENILNGEMDNLLESIQQKIEDRKVVSERE